MKKAVKARTQSPESLGDILRRIMCDLVLRISHLQNQKRRYSMDDCYDDYDGPEWEDWMVIGPLSEDIAREKREIDRIRRELDDADDDYWKWLNRK